MKRLLAISTLLILTACASPVTVAPTLPATTAPTAIPSNTPPPTVTPTNTATPTESPTPITFLHTLDTTQDYIFDQSIEGCVLPCWEGLHVGESHADDVEAVLDRMFGVNLADGQISNLTFWEGQEIAHGWDILDLDDPSYGTRDLEAYFWFEQGTETLLGIHFILAHQPFNQFVSPRQVVVELGQPDYMLYMMRQTAKHDLGTSDLIMIYEEGISFVFGSMIPLILLSYDDGGRRYSVEYCMGDRLIKDEQYAIRNTDIYLIPPLEDGLEKLSPIQDKYITPWIQEEFERGGEKFTGFGLIPIEDYFGLTISQVSDLLLQDDDACLYAEYIDD